MVIGLTGGIGSGKTTVVNMFRKSDNVAIYIADIAGKRLMNSSVDIQKKLIEIFGTETYQNGRLNNNYLANIVFNDKDKLSLLNNIVHPAVKSDFQNFVKQHQNASYIMYESAILFESNNAHLFDLIISVSAPLNERVKRIIKRDNTNESEILKRINNQWKEDKKLLQSHYLIHNSTLESTKNQVHYIHNILTKKKALIL
ncbi:dephospho-CoA kinase [Polaribacter tangerinus]|uniref:dephospho-CoA kinase n=1 Tax=Polaribacter tangerinus TaxID=1920034 RepID=UPI000B4A96BE|nr:dephospho-CoA kinase [Polaribacter tangerinus]